MRKAPLISVLLIALLAAIPAAAQTSNPALADCGFPAQGTIVQSVTYTLIDDCVLTGTLNIDGAITVTINGQGNTITYPNETEALLDHVSRATCSQITLNLNSVTIDADSVERSNVLRVCGVLNTNQVTLRGGYSGLFVSVLEGGNAAFTDTLFEDSVSTGLGNHSSNVSSAMVILNTGTATFHNVVLRGNRYSAAAVRVRSGGSLTATGCLWFAGNIPLNIDGTWTDNREGDCTGTIGNGATVRTEPPPAACGLPLGGLPDSGNLIVSRTYNLIADCDLAGSLYISEGLDVVINGNGRTIRTADNARIELAHKSTLTMDNVFLDRVRILNFGEMQLNRVSLSNMVGVGIVDFDELTIRDMVTDNNLHPVVYAFFPYGDGTTVIGDSVIRNTDARQYDRAALYAHGSSASITLEDCIIFENNQPRDTRAIDSATITDNSSSTCATPVGPGLTLTPPTSTPVPAATATPTDPQTPTATATPTDTQTPTATATPTDTQAPTAMPTDPQAPTATPTDPQAPTATPTPLLKREPSPTPTVPELREFTPTPAEPRILTPVGPPALTPTPTAPLYVCMPNERIHVLTANDDLRCEPVEIISLDKHPALAGVRFVVRLWRSVPQCLHRVAADDNLFRLAIRYRTTVEAFRSLNGIEGNHLSVGQHLLLPNCVLDGSLSFRNTRICFANQGKLLFIDTALSPPQVSALEQFPVNGMTCAGVFRPGLVALTAPDL